MDMVLWILIPKLLFSIRRELTHDLTGLFLNTSHRYAIIRRLWASTLSGARVGPMTMYLLFGTQ